MAKQSFGGDWTEVKLEKLHDYIRAYNRVLQNTSFHKIYIDAFAGTGWREPRGEDDTEDYLFPEMAEPRERQVLDGSARIALQVDKPGFDEFVFIEQKRDKVAELEKLVDEFSNKRILVEHGDANERVQAICSGSWSGRRAVLFLDPYGMQVAWDTLKSVAATKAIDTVILFPLCVAITRLLKRDGDISDTTRGIMNRFFGEETWAEAFYKPSPPAVTEAGWLFQDDPPLPEAAWKVDLKSVETYFIQRLEEIFEGVAKNPLRLRNSKGVPLYLLFFAAGNERGSPIAVKIAESILRSS